ncbi:aspartate/glutamate racemase family protein [Rhodobacteraceae bacterium 63075]|nr:aspartate/glutamate racemase family protein [Rhodobacteraceae bacterium 63075]
MHIGLIGGIGPAATVAYYQRLVHVFGQADVPLQLTIQHADMKTLTENAGRLDSDAQTEVFAAHIRSLKGAGCDIVGITALTGHFCMPMLQAVSQLPILSATDAINTYCAQHGIARLGLLGSPSVLKSRLFGLLHEVETVVPGEDPEGIGRTYMEIATKGACTTDQADLLITAGSEMMQAQQADAILLAGTDLGLVFETGDPGYPTIDAVRLHVDAFLEVAADKANLMRLTTFASAPPDTGDL